jgi:hypothetical protein
VATLIRGKCYYYGETNSVWKVTTHVASVLQTVQNMSHFPAISVTVPYGGEERCIQGSGGGNLRERDHLEDPGIDGRVILRWIFIKWDVGVWTGTIWLRIGKGGGHL